MDRSGREQPDDVRSRPEGGARGHGRGSEIRSSGDDHQASVLTLVAVPPGYGVSEHVARSDAPVGVVRDAYVSDDDLPAVLLGHAGLRVHERHGDVRSDRQVRSQPRGDIDGDDRPSGRLGFRHERPVGFADPPSDARAQCAVDDDIGIVQERPRILLYGAFEERVVESGFVRMDPGRFAEQGHLRERGVHEQGGGESVATVVPGTADEKAALPRESRSQDLGHLGARSAHEVPDLHAQGLGVGIGHPGIQGRHQGDRLPWFWTRISPIFGRSSVLDILPFSTFTHPCFERGLLG